MKSTIFKALLLPIALLALGSIHNASATTCVSVSGDSLAQLNSVVGSCTIGNLTFSNFAYAYSAGVDSGCGGVGQPVCPPAVSTPSGASNVIVTFDQITSGSDAFGTTATASSPITQVITDYSANTSVGQFQTETGVVQFLVTDTAANSSVTQVDGALTAYANSDTASGSFTKNLCNGQDFEGGNSPDGACVKDSDLQGAVSLGYPDPAGTQSDSTADEFGPISDTTFGVSDQWNEDGGPIAETSASAYITSNENDFQETIITAPPTSGTPEPTTFMLLGGALVALGAIRRKKSA